MSLLSPRKLEMVVETANKDEMPNTVKDDTIYCKVYVMKGAVRDMKINISYQKELEV